MGCVYLYKEIHYKELTHAIMEAGKSSIYSTGWQTQPWGVRVQMKPEAVCSAREFSLVQGGQAFCSIQAFN